MAPEATESIDHNIEIEGEIIAPAESDNEDGDRTPRAGDQEMEIATEDQQMATEGEIRQMVENKIKQIERNQKDQKYIEKYLDTKLTQQLYRLQVDVAEVYSPARVTKMAKTQGLQFGEAMNLTNGRGFTKKKHRDAAMIYVKDIKPTLRIGSPECRMFSNMQNLNKKKGIQ